MIQKRVYKSQSRPATASTSTDPVLVVPNTRKRKINQSKNNNSRIKVNSTAIHFNGFQDLVDNSLEFTAHQINNLFDPDPDDYGEDVKLRKNAVDDFMIFNQSQYFQTEATFSMTDDGELSADWRLKDKIGVNIVFHGKEEISLRVSSNKLRFTKYIKLSSLCKQLTKYNIPDS